MAIPTGVVRWSTAESRAAGRISILAIAETLFAVALYWWIAIWFDTHIHLVTSLFVAPLLLLRSERSIASGVRWFLRGSFDAEGYKEWSRPSKSIWLVVIAVLGSAVSWFFSYLVHFQLEDQAGSALFASAAAIGLTGSVGGLMVAVYAGAVIADAGTSAAKVVGTVAGAVASTMVMAVDVGASAGMSAGAGAVVGIGIVVVGMGIEMGMRYAIKYAIRAIVIRLLATLRFLFLDGIRSLPANWRENNFVIDSLTPAELVPGIGKLEKRFTLKGVVNWLKEEDRAWKFVFLFIIPVWFLPVLLYRLNIKATCWFYWPLAFLLRPLPDDDRMERRRHDLCWPWTNPAQLLLILAGLGWLLMSGLSWIGVESFFNRPDWPAVAFWLEYVLILDWSALEVWHWVNLVIAVTGALMLFIAGSAVAYYKAGRDYGQEQPWSLPVMHGLWRLRTLAVIAGLLLALGSVLVHLQPEWLAVLLGPQAQALRDFYGY